MDFERIEIKQLWECLCVKCKLQWASLGKLFDSWSYWTKSFVKNDVPSDSKLKRRGVPQGSVLGPLVKEYFDRKLTF